MSLGYKSFTIGDVCEIKYGKDHKKLKDGKIPVYGSGGIMRYADSFIYDQKSVLIPRKGSLSNLFYVDTPFWTVDTLFYTVINESIVLPEYLFYLLKTKDLSTMNVGSAVPSLTTSLLNAVSIELPSVRIQKKIVDILSSLDHKISINQKINHHLVS